MFYPHVDVKVFTERVRTPRSFMKMPALGGLRLAERHLRCCTRLSEATNEESPCLEAQRYAGARRIARHSSRSSGAAQSKPVRLFPPRFNPDHDGKERERERERE